MSVPRSVSWLDPPTFVFSGREYRYFFHYHNCGWPPYRCTERCVELALANYWLDQLDPDSVCEIGAVTPYYWPRRVTQVVDPADPHPLVTQRRSLFDVDLHRRSVLCISTLEHIGTGRYGLPEQPARVLDALAKILKEAERFLITVPIGYNRLLDDAVLANTPPAGNFTLRFLVRMPDQLHWRQESNTSQARRSYDQWADSVGILERGGIV